MHGQRSAIVAIALLVCACGGDKQTVTLSADAGNFNVRTLGPVASTAVLSVSVRLTAFNGSEAAWPPAAYAGFYLGQDRSNSVQFLIIRNHPSDDYLVAGYRVVEGGREAKVESLSSLPLNASVNAKLKIENGVFTLKVADANAVNIRTSLAEVAPYVSVSSGSAEFAIAP
jgi:hypothetical protein